MRECGDHVGLLDFWIAYLSVELRGATDHAEALEDALTLFLVGI